MMNLGFSENRGDSSMGVFPSRFPSWSTTSPLEHEKTIVLAKPNSEAPSKQHLAPNAEERHRRIQARDQQAQDAELGHGLPHHGARTRDQRRRGHLQEDDGAVGQSLRNRRQEKEREWR